MDLLSQTACAYRAAIQGSVDRGPAALQRFIHSSRSVLTAQEQEELGRALCAASISTVIH